MTPPPLGPALPTPLSSADDPSLERAVQAEYRTHGPGPDCELDPVLGCALLAVERWLQPGAARTAGRMEAVSGMRRAFRRHPLLQGVVPWVFGSVASGLGTFDGDIDVGLFGSVLG